MSEMTPYRRGFTAGKDLADRVLDLKLHTERWQAYPHAVPDVIPLDEEARRGWLRGYANGITSVTDDWPEKGSPLWPDGG